MTPQLLWAGCLGAAWLGPGFSGSCSHAASQAALSLRRVHSKAARSPSSRQEASAPLPAGAPGRLLACPFHAAKGRLPTRCPERAQAGRRDAGCGRAYRFPGLL